MLIHMFDKTKMPTYKLNLTYFVTFPLYLYLQLAICVVYIRGQVKHVEQNVVFTIFFPSIPKIFEKTCLYVYITN